MFFAPAIYNSYPFVPPQFSITTEAQGESVGTCPNKAFLISVVSQGPATEGRTATLVDDNPIGRAFASGASNINDTSFSLRQDRHSLLHTTSTSPRESTDWRSATAFALTASMSGTKKAESSIGRIMTRKIGVSQVG